LTLSLYIKFLGRELSPEELVIIDTEYTGHEKSIKNMLLALLWRDDPDFNVHNIAFGHVGKGSSAHKKALAVYQGKAKANRTLKARDLLSPITGL